MRFQARMLGVLPFPAPVDLPDPGAKATFPALAGRFFITEPPGKPQLYQLDYSIYGQLLLDFVLQTPLISKVTAVRILSPCSHISVAV